MNKIFYFPIFLLILSCGVDKPQEVVQAEALIPEYIDFNYDVKPILSDKCFACHGPDTKKQKSGLRLDTEEGAYAALKDGNGKHAIVPKSLRNSDVYFRMISDDPELKMPPPESNLNLSFKEIAIISRWIEQGAEYKKHWSFIKPTKSDIPITNNPKWVRTPIDAFVLERLETKNMKPEKEASKADLIRRASFDLRGLPPSIQEIDLFIKDKSPNAYEMLLDRLLTSPAYGERMATDWLDVARYADSDGYLDDKHRNFSPWRDWVIQAFNSNMPYKQFITWQLAGDLIPNKSKESILATAFNRLHKKNSEAGIVFEEYRVEYNADRLQTVSQGILGLSVQCARCHDHKYDPISQEAYYKMFGLFNSTNEIGTPVYGPDQTPGPALLLSEKEQEDLLKTIDQQQIEVETKIKGHIADSDVKFKSWVTMQGVSEKSVSEATKKSLVAYYPFDQLQTKTSKKSITPNLVDKNAPALCNEAILKPGIKGNAYFVSDYNSIQLGNKVGWRERTEPFTVDLWINPNTNYPDAGIFYHCEDIRLGYKGYSLRLAENKLQFIIAHSYPQNALQISTTSPVPIKKWTQVTVTYDGSSKANGMRIYIDGKPAKIQTDYDNLYKGILFEPNIHTYGFDGFTLGQRNLLIPFKDGGIDELKIYDRDLTALEVLYQSHPNEAMAIINASKTNNSLLKEFHLANIDNENKSLKKEYTKLLNQENEVINKIPEIMVMGDLPKPRPTYLLGRGDYAAREKVVTPGALETVLPFEKKFKKNRLGLANWLFDPENPLTARVLVNRVWQLHFGKGLVVSVGDFGNQGNLPSHPKLLDWLAVNFQESGWDIKKLHKTIMMSATYRQSSTITPEKQEIDPENILLARGARFRLSAEMIRDNALSISGLLVQQLGGESVYPYQPAGIWDELSEKSWRYKYLQEPGDGLYRRSLYTIWKRSSPPPAMLIFDAPERVECSVRRRPTSTPLQALVLLNDPQYLEAARKMAENLLHQQKDNPDLLLKSAFRLSTGRVADATEIKILRRFYDQEIKRFNSKPKDATDYLSTGELPWDRSLPPTQIAALATVTNAIMNTDEGYTRK